MNWIAERPWRCSMSVFVAMQTGRCAAIARAVADGCLSSKFLGVAPASGVAWPERWEEAWSSWNSGAPLRWRLPWL